MKKILLAILALALSSGVMAQRNQDVTFFLNLHCGSCMRLLDKEMPNVRGVRNFKADLRGKRIEISYNSRQTNPEKLRKALEKMGFTVRNTFEEIKDIPGRSCS